jgi:glycosyltransferase involved in cell wall biosynthesis
MVLPMGDGKPRILLGVTVDMSLRLMRGFPEYLVKRGWNVHVVSSPGEGLEELRHVDGVTAHSIAMAREPSPISDLIALAKWVSLLRRVKPDLISVGTPKAGLLGGIAGRLARVPHRIYLLRGLRLETSSGVRRKIFSGVERLAIGSAHHVIAVSPSLRDRALELKLAPPQKISVIGKGSSNGVNLELFDPTRFSDIERARLAESLGLIEGVPVVGFVGRLTHDKGLTVLARARMILAQNGVDHQLLVVGGLDDSSGEVSLDGDNGSIRPAIVTGHVRDPETYYQVMDLLCLPTLREGFPNVVLEAGAAGIPTVTTTATGAKDSVLDGSTGLLAVVNSAESLADRLSTLLTDKDRRRAMGLAAAGQVRAHFARDDVWDHTEMYYSEVLASVRRQRPGAERRGNS